VRQSPREDTLADLHRMGFRRASAISFAAAAVVAVMALSLALEVVVGGELRALVEARGQLEARVVEREAARALALEGQPGPAGPAAVKELESVLAPTLQEAGTAYQIVLRADRRVLARALRAEWAGRIDQIVGAHLSHPEGMGFWNDIAITTVPILARDAPPGAAPMGWVLRGTSAAPLKARILRVRVTVVAVLCAGMGALLAGMLWLSRRLVERPVQEMAKVAGALARLRLDGRVAGRADGEMGDLAAALDRVGPNLAEVVGRLRGVEDGVARVIEKASSAAGALGQSADRVIEGVDDAGTSMSSTLQSINGIASNVEVLAQSAEESAASILEMAHTNEEVVGHIAQLAQSVGETSTAIEEMTRSIKEVAQNVEHLAAAADQTAFSVTRMDDSIGQVGSNANETAKLSEQAQRDAEQGAQAISRTLAGIDKIKDSSREAAAVIQSLGMKIDVVGNILNVIGDVAEQTNLLALNAAILAAQSGEHGKGFAVVADEIKELAERTGASTKEISELIRAVQDESLNAVAAMQRGVKNVEEGVKLGQDAETALKKIQASSQKSTQMVKAIAAATVEQARGSKQLTAAIGKIAQTVQQIAAATSEQARGSEQIMKSADQMRLITKHVERSSQEQARGTKQASRSIESISEMVNQLNRAQKEQAVGSETVLESVRRIRQVAEAQAGSIRQLEDAVQGLAEQAEILKATLGRFQG